jgi:Family of unknown function (DUF6866) N-terminal domain/Family of unknown function (DUF6866) C-terminal domain
MLTQTFLDQVTANCQVAAASQAGRFSLCGTLLRLRQLYKWEHHLDPWQEPDTAAVLEWIEVKERAWEALEGTPWQPLTWGRQTFEPQAVEALNRHLLPQGFAYGAGLSRGLAPTCFLGELHETRRLDDLTILILGPELARDLDAAPALRQGPLIYLRRQTLAYYLWDRLSDPTQQKNVYLQIALQAYGLELASLLRQPEAHCQAFAALVTEESEAIIHHEIGEAREPSLGTAFAALLELFPQSRIELWLRALKDSLAEVNEFGRFSYLIEGRRLPSLALLLAWRPPFYGLLMPELEPAWRRMKANGDWEELETTRKIILSRLRGVAGELQELLATSESAASGCLKTEIQLRYLTPLGL